jgi:hypothetical protein
LRRFARALQLAGRLVGLAGADFAARDDFAGASPRVLVDGVAFLRGNFARLPMIFSR